MPDRMMSTRFCSVCVVFVLRSMGAQSRPPIIDVHLHSHRLADYGGARPVCANNSAILYLGLDRRAPITPDSLSRLKRCTTPVPSSANDDALMRETFAILDR